MIKFKELSYKNFLSVGNSPITIDLDRTSSTLITGHNGSGKTTIIEAITYCLYGKPYRKVKLGNLINSVNKKALLTTIDFETNGKQYTVKRGEKPKVFEIYEEGKLLDSEGNSRETQQKLERILGMDFQIFTQIVVINQNRFEPFLELAPADRRRIVEEILDISVFGFMAEEAKIAKSENNSALIDKEYEIKTLESTKTGLQRALETANNSQQQIVDDLEQQLKEVSDSLFVPLQEKDSKEFERDEVDTKLKEFGTTTVELNSKMDKIKSIVTQQTQRRKDAQKLFDVLMTGTCPTCTQEIHDDFLQDQTVILEDIGAEVDEYIIKAKEGAEKVSKQLSELGKLVDEKRNLETELQVIDNTIKSKQSTVQQLKDKIVAANEKKPDNTVQLETEISEAEKNIHESENVLEELHTQRQNIELAIEMLKDSGVKSLIIKEYIPYINQVINECLDLLEMPLCFYLNDDFDEEFTSPNRENFNYQNCSAGQKRRIDLAIMMAWLDLAQSKNSIDTNLLFLDEVLETIDTEGVSLAMAMLKQRLQNKNLFLITQRGPEFVDHFASHVQFKLEKGFTRLI